MRYLNNYKNARCLCLRMIASYIKVEIPAMFLHDKLQSDLNIVVSWTEHNFLSLNRSKTQAMIVGSRAKLKQLLNPTPQ